MAGKLNLELKVGIFVFIGLIILTLAIFSIGEMYFFRPGYYIMISFSFASGIDIGAPVRVAGINKGEVKDIQLGYDGESAQAKILLKVWLERNVKVPQDSRAYVNVLGLIGDSYLEIIPGKDYAHLLKEGDVLVGTDPISSQNLMELAYKLSANFDNILNLIDEILDEETKLALKQSIHNFRDFSQNLKNITKNLDIGVLDEETAKALRQTIHNFEAFSASIKVITGRLERGEGKLGAWLKPRRRPRRTKR
jgi:phospholipid/cholesterol/gamma-HCH transport system substrate-binding protein